MKINQWSRDALLELGLSEKDAQELRGLGVRLQLLEETLLRETREAAEASADETPLSPMEKKWQQLMNRVHRILDRYPELLLTADENDRGVALYRASDWLAALEGGGLEALSRVPAVEITW